MEDDQRELNLNSPILQRVLKLRKQLPPSPALSCEQVEAIHTHYPDKWSHPELVRLEGLSNDLRKAKQ